MIGSYDARQSFISDEGQLIKSLLTNTHALWHL